MNLPEITYPQDTKDRVRNLLVQEARRIPKRRRKWLALPVVIAVAGIALAGTIAAGVYTANAPVNDNRGIRCYYRADLNTTYPVKANPKVIMPPYITTGNFLPGFDAKNNPNPGDPDAGMQQISDPVNQCGRNWDLGLVNPQGITDDLIPDGFVQTKPTADPSKSSANGMPSDKYGNPLGGPAGPNKLIGHYVPQLTACVVDNSVAVIPGGPEVCAHLGIPSLEK